MKGKNEMDVFKELTKRDPTFLDRPLEELIPISFIGQAAVSAYRSMISRLDSLPMSEKQKQKTLVDGQDAGINLLAIEAKIGELLPRAEDAMSGKGISRGEGGRSAEPRRPVDIKKDQAKIARTIANNPEVVEEVIKEAEENEDIPTKTAVLNKVKLKKYKEKHSEEKNIDRPDISAIGINVNNSLTNARVKLKAIWPEREYLDDVLIDSIIDSIADLYDTIGGGE